MTGEQNHKVRDWIPFIRSMDFGLLASIFVIGSIAISFIYDLGFFLILGISYFDAPTSLTDYLQTWLFWIPVMVLGIYFGIASWQISLMFKEVFSELKREVKVHQKSSKSIFISLFKISWFSICFLGIPLIIGLFFGVITPFFTIIFGITGFLLVYRVSKISDNNSTSDEYILIILIYYSVYFYRLFCFRRIYRNCTSRRYQKSDSSLVLCYGRGR